MNVKPSQRFALAAVLLCGLIALSACKKSTVQAANGSTADEMQVSVPESLQSQIQVSEVTSQAVSDTLRVAGQIDFDEQALTRIGASVTGRVTQIQAQLGHVVNKGDTLALINSSELSGSQLAYLRARSEKELHRRNVERAKTLYEADIISAAELHRRESEYEIASAETRAAQDQLRVLGVNAKAIDRLAATGAIDSGWINVGGPGGSDGGSVGGTDTATDAGVSDGLGLALGLAVGLDVGLAVGLADGLLDGVGVGVGVGVGAGVLVVCAITIGTAGEVTATTGPRFP